MTKTIQLLALIASLLSLSVFAAEEPLEIAFEAHRVTVDDRGNETLALAETAFPGDVIQYTAVYTNTSENPLKDVRPVIPVPRGMAVDLKTVHPAAADGSLDGVRFAPMPLTGKEGEPVSPENIRALRWHLPQLETGKPVKIAFRVKVDS